MQGKRPTSTGATPAWLPFGHYHDRTHIGFGPLGVIIENAAVLSLEAASNEAEALVEFVPDGLDAARSSKKSLSF